MHERSDTPRPVWTAELDREDSDLRIVMRVVLERANVDRFRLQGVAPAKAIDIFAQGLFIGLVQLGIVEEHLLVDRLVEQARANR